MADAVEFVVKIPVEVVPMIEYCARAQGWRPMIPNPNGSGEIENPVSAIQIVFGLTVQVVKANAINAFAAEQAETARQQAVTQMEAAANAWQAAMTSA